MGAVERARARLASIAASHRTRQVVDIDGGGPEGVLPDGRRIVSFASNDYLGLSQHPKVREAAQHALDRWGAGSGSARLIVGSRPIHSELENELARWKSEEAALLFSSGYTANMGVLSVMGPQEAVIYSDELNHASIVDGCRLARAATHIYPHNDFGYLRAKLSRSPAVVVTDAVFSMDGDIAPMKELSAVCGERGALLVTDEAHDVFGVTGSSPAAEHLRVGTLSKFLGSSGGFVAGPAAVIDLLCNEARTFIYTTASPPADAAAAIAALGIYRSAEGADLRDRLRLLIEMLAPGHPSPIIPFVFGDESAAMKASSDLLELGLLVPAIRPPSVPAGSSRLRVTVSALHTDEQVERLLVALDRSGALMHA